MSAPAGSLSLAVQQMVAVARAVDVSAKVLILDEPTSSLDRQEVARLFNLMRRLRDRGLAILFVTHFLDQVYDISDRITVLRNGTRVGTFETAELPRMDLIGHMIGRPASQVQHRAPEGREATDQTDETNATKVVPRAGPVFVTTRGLGKRGSIEPFDMDIFPGEVVALAGLLGSGRTEIARLLFGVDKADSGTLKINGENVTLRDPRGAVRRRIALCPEDRKATGIIPDLSVRENIVLALQARRGWVRKIGRRRQNQVADEYIQALYIATSDAEKPIKLLSGGNQQKVLLARWLLTEPRLLILDEPTRGIDIGAKFEIATLIDKLCAEGMAVLFISSELEEVVRTAGRVVVLRDHRKVGELIDAGITEQQIMATIAAAPAVQMA